MSLLDRASVKTPDNNSLPPAPVNKKALYSILITVIKLVESNQFFVAFCIF
uniref:Uncharacterized protein n=1 Tax=Anguilla anguilla TaxID=7936 RepID=A0A0E9T8Y4_ANGAN